MNVSMTSRNESTPTSGIDAALVMSKLKHEAIPSQHENESAEIAEPVYHHIKPDVWLPSELYLNSAQQLEAQDSNGEQQSPRLFLNLRITYNPILSL